MTKFQIFPPAGAEYPLTVIWVEDRKDHYVRKDEVIAVLNAASGWINISAPFPGIIDTAEVSRGDRLKERKALLVLRQEAAAPVRTPGEAAPLREQPVAQGTQASTSAKQDKPAASETEKAAKTGAKPARKSRFGFGELALLASFALVGWVAYDHFTSPFSGPLSKEAMAAVKVNPADLAPRGEWGAVFPGQGMIVLQDRTVPAFSNANRDRNCGAAMIADTFAAFDAKCFSREMVEVSSSGGRARADFLFRDASGGRITEYSFPIKALHYWGFGSADNAVALAELAPAAGGGKPGKQTGLSGYMTISTSTPPAFAEQIIPARDLSVPNEVKGLRYWSSDRPAFKDDKLLALPLIFEGISPLSSSDLAGQGGLLRAPNMEGKIRLAGFVGYRKQMIPPKTASEEKLYRVTVSASFFSDDDFAHMSAATAGKLAAGATRFPLDSTRASTKEPIALRNTCSRPVRFNFIDPAEDRIRYIDIAARDDLLLEPLNLGPKVYYSIDTGSPTAPGAKAIAFNGTTYHMHLITLEGIRLGLIARDCR